VRSRPVDRGVRGHRGTCPQPFFLSKGGTLSETKKEEHGKKETKKERKKEKRGANWNEI